MKSVTKSCFHCSFFSSSLFYKTDKQNTVWAKIPHTLPLPVTLQTTTQPTQTLRSILVKEKKNFTQISNAITKLIVKKFPFNNRSDRNKAQIFQTTKSKELPIVFEEDPVLAAASNASQLSRQQLNLKPVDPNLILSGKIGFDHI